MIPSLTAWLSAQFFSTCLLTKVMDAIEQDIHTLIDAELRGLWAIGHTALLTIICALEQGGDKPSRSDLMSTLAQPHHNG
jgi:hypothetical protein